MKSICFVSLKSYDLIRGSSAPRYVGGAERQQVLVGQGLRDLGYKVSFITLDYGQPDGIEHNGLRVFKAYDTNRGLPGLRFFFPRWFGLWAAMRRANADIYHQMGADAETGQVALWCRQHGRRFVFAVASDVNCLPCFPRLYCGRQRWLYRYGLTRADFVVAQTCNQQKDLERHFGIRATIIPSCARESGLWMPPKNVCPKGNRVTLLWVSRIVPVKRLEWLLELATQCPAYDFVVVGDGDPSDPYVANLLARARSLPNVRVLGRVSDEQLWKLYSRSDLLVDTACVAGVPTTFLEAWARGLPVVTTVNPDGVVSSHNLGRVASSVEQMLHAVAELIGDSRRWHECSRSALSYYEQNHTVQAAAAAYHRLLSDGRTLASSVTAGEIASSRPTGIDGAHPHIHGAV